MRIMKRSAAITVSLIVGGVLVIGLAPARAQAPNLCVPAASLREGRFSHTATLLKSGKVLVTGGRTDGGSGVLASAEVYDSRDFSEPTTDRVRCIDEYLIELFSRASKKCAA